LGEAKRNLPPQMGKQDGGQMQLNFQIKELWKDCGLSAQNKICKFEKVINSQLK
jgi:hypothetical protein